MKVEIIPPLKKHVFAIEMNIRPGRKIPTVKELKEILNGILDPHIEFNVRSSYAERQNC